MFGSLLSVGAPPVCLLPPSCSLTPCASRGSGQPAFVASQALLVRSAETQKRAGLSELARVVALSFFARLTDAHTTAKGDGRRRDGHAGSGDDSEGGRAAARSPQGGLTLTPTSNLQPGDGGDGHARGGEQ
ncbi:hypothetical protein THAOC_18386 [Thalassiosira oceanica]|uniref:Uncharacterized protein n=1 Tax=Thalassiosira oceanica TaxID=159749 RepID=K0S543_THAOC|nr:hypothetical protein THAOC_18386 [Thalassiosira oceanica]|eukprot:EJK61173.1 hypothetical protein THAOC_18386 [Thalassiosira oceanica]